MECLDDVSLQFKLAVYRYFMSIPVLSYAFNSGDIFKWWDKSFRVGQKGSQTFYPIGIKIVLCPRIKTFSPTDKNYVGQKFIYDSTCSHYSGTCIESPELAGYPCVHTGHITIYICI